MPDAHDTVRPTLSADAIASQQATEAVSRFVAVLQAGLDAHDADVYNRHFADDAVWGSPYGATVHGYEELHAVHVRLLEQGTGGPSSRYEIERVLAPTSDVAVAQVRRVTLDPDGRRLSPSVGGTGAFSEMALYVLVRRDGTWWLAAGQNTPIRPSPRHPAGATR